MLIMLMLWKIIIFCGDSLSDLPIASHVLAIKATIFGDFMFFIKAPIHCCYPHSHHLVINVIWLNFDFKNFLKLIGYAKM